MKQTFKSYQALNSLSLLTECYGKIKTFKLYIWNVDKHIPTGFPLSSWYDRRNFAGRDTLILPVPVVWPLRVQRSDLKLGMGLGIHDFDVERNCNTFYKLLSEISWKSFNILFLQSSIAYEYNKVISAYFDLVVLQAEMPFCVQISCFFIVFSHFISFIKMELFLSSYLKWILTCVVVPVYSKSIEN